MILQSDDMAFEALPYRRGDEGLLASDGAGATQVKRYSEGAAGRLRKLIHAEDH